MFFLNNVAKYFNGKPLFEQVNLSVHRGDRVGIVGPNGAGKSTILGMMEGVLSPDSGEVSIEKKIRVGILHQELIQGSDGPIIDEIMNVSDELREIRRRLKELESGMTRLSENSSEATGLLEEHGALLHEFERYNGYTLEARALKTLQGLGFKAEDGRRRWSEFSGGWRMRVALAKILLSEPDALLLDEPTNHLDLESLIWVEEYLSGFKGALVLVSHDRAFLNKLVTRIFEVSNGKVTSYTGNYDDFESNKQTQEEILVSAYKNQQEKIKRIEKFVNQNRVKARTASRVQSRLKMLDKMEKVELPTRQRKLKFSFPSSAASGKRTLQINDLVKRYNSNVVYNGFDFSVDRGERVGLIGPNGAGKSTLMKIIAGMIPYDSGIVKYGHNVKPGYFAQHQSEMLNSELTVLEEAYSTSSTVTEQEVRNLLGAFLFSGDDVFKKVKVLSGGEKSRLALTKILLSPPNLLLMDEPTNHLDIPSCEILEEGLKKYDGTLILITHDRRLMNAICTGILEVEKGRQEYFIGNYEDYIYKKKLIDAEFVQNGFDQPVMAKTSFDKENDKSEEKESRKDRKRREAQNRIILFKKQEPIRKEIEALEKKLAEREQRSREITTFLSDPTNYERKENIRQILEEEPIVSQDIKFIEKRWEELHIELDEIERSCDS